MNKKPSSDQLEAITHFRGPLELIAGPGSGKTFVIVSRIINLIKNNGISPDHILVVTFSKAAAAEMQTRFYKETGNGICPVFGTFHSAAFGILRESFKLSPAALIGEREKKKMLSVIFKDHGYGVLCENEYLSGILNDISKSKNVKDYTSTLLHSDNESISDDALNAVVKDYSAFLKEQGRIDFDDMIIECIDALRKNERVLNMYRDRFEFILVDEFQDINAPQYDLLRMLSYPRNNLFVVGDDDQSIYGFRGSTPGIMQDFFKDYPGARKLMLTENYRSGDKIVDIAGKVILKNKLRFEKEFKPKMRGGAVTFKRFLSHKDEELYLKGILRSFSYEELKRSAVILRTNREVSQFSSLLQKNGVLVSGIEGKSSSLFESGVFLDVSAFLGFIFAGGKREDFIRFMNKPNRYIRKAALTDDIVCFEGLKRYYAENSDMLRTLNELQKKLELAKKLSAPRAISIFKRAMGYEDYLKENAKEETELQNNMEYLKETEEIFERYSVGMPLEAFIKEAERKYTDGNMHKNAASESAGISVLTMHRSKGLEFDTVFLPDVNEGVIPPKNTSDKALEEERRLLYVAMTRARLNLYILATNERNRDVSRFIKGIVT